MMNPGKRFLPLFFLLAFLNMPLPVMGLEYLSQPLWEVPIPHPDTSANQTPVIHGAENGRLISLNFPYEPVLFVYDENGTLLFNTTRSAEKTPWLSSVSPVPDGSGLAVTQLVPGCCHGSDSNTTSNRILFFDRTGRIVWEYVTVKPPLASAVLPTTRDIIVGTDDGRIVCLDRNGSVRWIKHVEAPVVSLTTSADGSTIVAGGDSNYDSWKHYREPLNPFDLFFLDTEGNILGKYQTRGQNTVAASRNASLIAVIGGPFGNLMLFNRTGKKTGERSFSGTVSGLSLNGDGTRIVVGISDGRVYCLDGDLKEIREIGTGAGSQAIEVSETGDSIAIGNGRNVTLYRITGENLRSIQTDSRIRFISAIPGTGSFLVGTEQKMLFFTMTAPKPYQDLVTDKVSPTGLPVTSAPLPALVVLLALGVCSILPR